jgi:hypothetical protein
VYEETVIPQHDLDIVVISKGRKGMNSNFTKIKYRGKEITIKSLYP